MRARALVLALLFFGALPARADPPAPAPLPAEKAAPVPAQVLAALSRDALHVFLDEYLQYDLETGLASRGHTHAPVERAAFFDAVGRPELGAQVRRTERKRLFLYVGAGAAVVAGVITGAVLLSSRPDLNSDACVGGTVSRYNSSCGEVYRSRGDLGYAAFGGGAALGLVLAGLAHTLDSEPIARPEAQRLAATYNTQLREKLEAGASKPAESLPISFTPVVGPGGAGLLATARF